jgi:hypothetical protein
LYESSSDLNPHTALRMMIEYLCTCKYLPLPYQLPKSSIHPDPDSPASLLNLPRPIDQFQPHNTVLRHKSDCKDIQLVRDLVREASSPFFPLPAVLPFLMLQSPCKVQMVEAIQVHNLLDASFPSWDWPHIDSRDLHIGLDLDNLRTCTARLHPPLVALDCGRCQCQGQSRPGSSYLLRCSLTALKL